MRIAYITAGAAGMYCGSCMHDNTLAGALIALGHDALLIPTYTPIRTDEEDVSQKRVFFGGINVYLQQKSSLFRHTPWFLDRLLDAPGLLRWVSRRFAAKTKYDDLGDLTLSVLRGEHGHQRKEIDKLVRWLASDVRPEIVILTNVLLSGMAEPIQQKLNVPIVAMLQGDDIFLDALPDQHRQDALALIRANSRNIAGFIATSRYYADYMAGYLGIPREPIDVVYPGLNLKGHGGGPGRNGPPFTIGYFARICPEKGLHVLVDAYRLLRQMPGVPPTRLHVSGWLGDSHRPYFEELQSRLRASKLDHEFTHVESPDHASKVRFLQSLDVLSVPTTYREPKGLYVLEALANGVPVVQPRHGTFPELIEETGGGLLVAPEDPADLARALRHMIDNPERRLELGRIGNQAVRERFHAAAMAAQTVEVLRQYLK